MAEPSTIKPNNPVIDGIVRASQRSMGMFFVGSTVGLTWGFLRGVGALWTYPLFVGGNCAFVSLPCFGIREIIGDRIPDSAASAVSGAIGGFGAMTMFSSVRNAPKGAIAFSIAGVALERLNHAFYEFKARKREELLRERAEEQQKRSNA